ncbi:PDZ/DHR/GLGF domain protein [Ancylostoma caninum]|uniref:PDZ/DHR/GLGF domain protein n=1 Tax=Ancylostoma caninum TaxID=29170 RepID=A0A368F154_ANCCA|nr:PDZ/DHR/GLGF domain protein [Ancylostoma caninum]
MNRSDPSIRWGFTLRQQGNRIVVATVDRDSLSDKAGMKSGDEVDTVCGRNAVNMSVNEANSIVDSSYQEVHFNLRRYVTTHTCLPWTLTEKDNKLIVDDMQPGYGSGFGGSHGFDSRNRSTTAHSKSSWDTSNQLRNTTAPYQSNYQSNYSTQR